MPSGNLGREFYVRELQKDIPVDVYGDCGDYKCPKVREREQVQGGSKIWALGCVNSSRPQQNWS